MSVEYATAYASLLLDLPDLPQRSGIYQSNDLDWHLFTARSTMPQAEEMPLVDIALANDGTNLYTVFLQSPEEEHEALFEEIFMGAIDALRPMDSETRDRLGYEDLMAAEYSGTAPVNNRYFLPLGEAAPAIVPFEGVLSIPEFEMGTFTHNSDGLPRPNQAIFPALSIPFFIHDDYIVPAVREIVPAEGEGSYWDVVFSPGKVWSEKSDQGMSRASFPFLLVADDYNEAHNGLATFLYDDQRVSSLFIQIVQETAAWHHTDFWGQAEVSYEPQELRDKRSLAVEFIDELAGLWPVRPWSELEAGRDNRLMAGFVSNGNLEEFSATGLVNDRTIYLQGCYTRYGNYPFCQFMRHGVFSVTKSMGAAVAMLRLAQKYGDQVYELLIADYVDIKAEHNGWQQVTFGDALDMATGVGDHVPEPIEPNIMFGDEDEDRFLEFCQADSRAEKLAFVFTYADYPWGPGQITRYNSINTFILSAAMDSFLKSQEGQEADIWDMVVEEVYRPIGVLHAPIMRTVEPDDGRGLPVFGYGLYPTVDDVAKVAQLFHDDGRYQGQQLLHPAKLAEALFQDGHLGFPSGMPSPDGEVRYGHAFYGLPFEDDTGVS
jgi:CubicO group peptidase (beta-lactamase class C family)